jgi:fumarylacetoacetase-like protein
MVISGDLSHAAPATEIATTMQEALDRWDQVAPMLDEPPRCRRGRNGCVSALPVVTPEKNVAAGFVQWAPFLELMGRLWTWTKVRRSLENVASLRGESSNQLLETLEEWNDDLERQCACTPTAAAILSARCCRVSKAFSGSFGLYLDESDHQAGRQ